MRTLSTLKSATCAVILLATALPAVAQDDYADAAALYKSRKYFEAQGYFARAWRTDPNNASAGYYAAYCLYLAGQRANAIAGFWELVERLPDRREAIMARQLLSRIDPDFTKHVSENQKQNPVKTSAVFSKRSPGSKEIIDRLVQVMPPKGKVPPVTPAFEQRIKQILATVPVPILQFLVASDAKVALMPSVVELDYRIQNTTPRGWDETASWKNSPALTHGKVVAVAQYRMDEKTGDYIDTTASDEFGVVRHELGHALDYCLGTVSDSEDFKHAYFLDAAKVPEERRAKIEYFLQKSHAGPGETFAELCCYKFGGETGGRVESCELVNQYFPTTRAELEKYFKKIESMSF